MLILMLPVLYCGGLSQVIAKTMPRAQKRAEKGSNVSNDDGLCPSIALIYLWLEVREYMV